MNTEKWLTQNTSSLSGKKIAITGSTGGIGVWLCSYLARLGADLILCDRSYEKVSKLISSLKVKYPKANVKHIYCDLTHTESVISATKALIDEDIYCFISNAGAYSIPREICKCGLDNVFTINFASPYYIIRELLPTIEKNSGRAVVVGSIAHNYSKADFDDVDFRYVKAASKAYGNAKRYLMFALFEHCKDKKCLSITHPGITFTNITSHYPKLIFAIIKHPMKIIFTPPRRACLSILRGVFEPTGYKEWIGPSLFSIWGKPKKKKLKTCKDTESKKIYEIAEKIYLDTLKNQENN